MQKLASRKRSWAAVWAVALVFRVSFVLSAPLELMWVDGVAYEAIGHDLATTGEFTGAPRYPPAYPYFIAGVYSVAGRNLLALRLMDAVVSLATVVLVGVFGTRLFSRPVGLVASTLAALHPVMAFLPVTQYTENLLMFIMVAALGAFGLAMARPSLARWALSGSLFGLGLLCKPAVLALLPGMAFGAWFDLGRRGHPRLLPAFVFLAFLVLAISPWVIRNHRVHSLWFVTSGGGIEFWSANNKDASSATDWKPDRPQWLVDSLAVIGDDSAAQDRLYHAEGWRFIRENPQRALSLYVARMGNIWALYPRTATKTQYSNRLADWTQGIASAVIFIGTLLGVAHLRRFGLVAFPMSAISYTVMAAMFYTVMRYRMALEIMLLWTAGLGYVWLLRRLASPKHDAGDS